MDKTNSKVPDPKMLPYQGDGQPRPPTAFTEHDDLRVQNFSDSEDDESVLGEDEESVLGEDEAKDPINEVEEWKEADCSWRPIIWRNLIQIDKNWKSLNELIDFSSSPQHPRQKFYPAFKISEIKAAFAECGVEYKTELDDEQFYEVRDEDGNTNLHLAILGVANEQDEDRKKDAKKVLEKLFDGAIVSLHNIYAPFLQKDKDGNNAIHLAAAKLEDFAEVRKFFNFVKSYNKIDSRYWLEQTNADRKTVFDIVAQREDCDFKREFEELFNIKAKDGFGAASALQLDNSQQGKKGPTP